MNYPERPLRNKRAAFATLTYAPVDGQSLEQQPDYYMNRKQFTIEIAKMMRAIQDKYGKLDYMQVFEPYAGTAKYNQNHKTNKQLHAHIIIFNLPWTFIKKDLWHYWKHGRVDLEDKRRFNKKKRNGQACGVYLGKYMTKDNLELVPRYQKAFNTSEGLKQAEQVAPSAAGAVIQSMSNLQYESKPKIFSTDHYLNITWYEVYEPPPT